MRILKLAASNVMRLKAVEIEPAGTVQVIAGKNGAGKSSVLNALFLALAGGTASREIAKPVRAGEEWAEVKVDIGDEKGVTLIVTRTWDDHGKTTLTIKAPDGATYKSPQTLLDGLIGSLSFDPLAFTRMSPKAQREALLELLGLDFTEADAERARLYGIREDTGRRKRAFGDLPKLPKNAPTTEVSAAAIVDKISAVQEQQRHHDAEMRKAEQAQSTREYWERKLAEATAELDAAKRAEAAQSKVLKALPEYPSIEPLRAELAQIEERNAQARENRRIVDARDAQKALEEEYAALSHRIDAIDQSKAAAIAAADMPVAGLGFDSDGVTFNGVPFSQASSAEQIRVSLAMAMALNPTLRVIRIMDGSLLDADSMAAIRAAAEENDVQVFLEMVGDGGGDPAAVVIEEGEVLVR